MRPWAPATQPKTLPRSLSQRLALLENEGPWPTRRRTFRRFLRFAIPKQLGNSPLALGVTVSGLVGCGGLLCLALLGPQQMAAFLPNAITALATAPTEREQKNASPRGEAAHLASFDMPIRRGERGRAPFPVRLVGAADDVIILLRGLPAAATLSKGKRRDGQTWALRLHELEDLQVILGKGTPDSFDVTIEVTSKTGAQMSKAIARVRLVDAAAARAVHASSTPRATSIAR